MIPRLFFKTPLMVALIFACFVSSAQTQYKVLPASKVEVSGTSTLSNWIVRSEELSGEILFAPSAKSVNGSRAAQGTISRATVTLDVSSMKSEKGETMDNKMYNALKKDSYPAIMFSLQRAMQLTGAATVAAVGEITLAGVTKPIIFDLNMDVANDTFHFHGQKSLKLSDFQIEPPTAMFGQIETGDDITVIVDVSFGK
jgi:polyisoprenoid-binding protein YceI